MHSSTSVLRRYTPPTCTLEIAAKGSPLSRWVGRPLVQRLKFTLHFDDPRVPEEKRVTVRGDRTQLQALCDVVQTYVQDFIGQSPDRLNASLLASAPTDETELPDTDGRATNSSADTTATLEISEFDRADSEEIPQHHISQSSDLSSVSTDLEHLQSDRIESSNNPTAASVDRTDEIFLQPNGLLFHDLYLGSLATESSGSVIHLSLLQLFDLATALDEYTSELELLPNLNSAAGTKTPVVWAKIAALALVTVGISTAAVKMLDRKTTNPETSPTVATSQPTPTEQPQVAVVPTPLLTPGVPTPGVPTPPLSSPQTLPALPPSASSLSPTPGAIVPPGSAVPPTPGATVSPGSGVSPTPSVPPSVTAPAPPNSTTAPSASINGQAPPSSPSQSEQYKLPLNSDVSQSGTGSQTRSQKPVTERTTVQIIPSPTAATPAPNGAIVQTSKPSDRTSVQPTPSRTPAQRQERPVASSSNQSVTATASGASVSAKSKPTPQVTATPTQPMARITPPPARELPRIAAPPAQELPRIAAPPAQELPRIAAPPAQELPRIAAPPAQELPRIAAPPAQELPRIATPPAQELPRITPPPAQDVPSIATAPSQEVPRITPLPTQEMPAIKPPDTQEFPPITPPPIRELPQIATAPTQTANVKPPAGARSNSPAAQPSPSATAVARGNSSTTLFDAIPQIGEARNYFQSRWQPPASLTQRLEYSLTLNHDGSIRQIIPLGQLAKTYIDRTEMPLVGESFVSPIEGKHSPKIRVVLSPDGKVETFLESLN
ncbi:DUF4335 domain-containing protein [Aerosakkonema sp. BLCC-F183]|uniref:DUF4335 domain-containing protein n=1 Tax=Aerosakkonema sp. BLCC-F183 TaxID=3342834 RepID=UPI0035B9BD2C